MASGRVASMALSPFAADVAKRERACMTFMPAPMVEAPAAESPGTAETTRPAASVTTPARPSVSTQASSVVATVV